MPGNFGLLQTGPQQPQGTQFFKDAAEGLMKTDPQLKQDIRMRAHALNLQAKQMMRLMQIGGAMGEDVSALSPIMKKLMGERERVMREIIGRANVPTSASKPSKPKVKAPQL